MRKYLSIFVLTIFATANLMAQNFKDEAIEAKDPKYVCFVQLSDSVGTIIKYTTLKYKTPPLSYGYLQGDGEKLPYGPEDLLAFQDDKGYWLRVSNPVGGTKPVIGKLPFTNFFAVRIKSGKLELFMQYMNNGRGVLDNGYESGRSYFLRKGAVITGLDKFGVGLKNAVKDNKNISADFEDRFGKGKIKDVIEIIDEYNGK